PDEAEHLVEQRQRIAHAALRGSADDVERTGLDLEMLALADVEQACAHHLGRDALEVIALATREDGDGNFVRLRRGENELQVRRRLLQELQQRIEGADR